jgi:hypothetical protein
MNTDKKNAMAKNLLDSSVSIRVIRGQIDFLLSAPQRLRANHSFSSTYPSVPDDSSITRKRVL